MKHAITLFTFVIFLVGCSSVVETEKTTQSKASRQKPSEVSSKGSNNGNEQVGVNAQARPAIPAEITK